MSRPIVDALTLLSLPPLLFNTSPSMDKLVARGTRVLSRIRPTRIRCRFWHSARTAHVPIPPVRWYTKLFFFHGPPDPAQSRGGALACRWARLRLRLGDHCPAAVTGAAPARALEHMFRFRQSPRTLLVLELNQLGGHNFLFHGAERSPPA